MRRILTALLAAGLPLLALGQLTPQTALQYRFSDGNIYDTFGTARLYVPTVAALQAASTVNVTTGTTYVVKGYNAAGDGGGGLFIFNATSTATVDGGTIIAPLGGVGRWVRSYQGLVDARWFGTHGDGTTDDTTPIMNAIACAELNALPLSLKGNFAVTNILMTGANSLNVDCDCRLIGISGTAQTAVLELASCTNLSFNGSLNVTGSYSTNYTSGIYVWSATSGQYNSFYNVTLNGCQVAWLFGNATYPNATISENHVIGGHTYGCPICFECVGYETVLNVIGGDWSSDYGSGSGGWLSLPERVLLNIGATVHWSGGEALLTASQSGICCEDRPIASSPNYWGSLYLTGVVCESASPLAVADNPGSIGTLNGGVMQFTSCLGFHGSDAAAFISSSSDYLGIITVRDCNFYASVTQTFANISCAGLAHVYSDGHSFGTNFETYPTGFSGGIVNYDLITYGMGFLYQNIAAGGLLRQSLGSKVSNVGTYDEWTTNGVNIGYLGTGDQVNGAYQDMDLESVAGNINLDIGATKELVISSSGTSTPGTATFSGGYVQPITGLANHFYNNFATAGQTPVATTRTYITGSQLHFAAAALKVGTILRWHFDMTKTAAGSASSTIDIAFGTAGTTSDTARVSFTKPAGTAAGDEGWVDIEAIVQTNSSSGVVLGNFRMIHNLASTGHMTIPAASVETTSSAFDTTLPTYVGLCITTGTSDAITINQCSAEALNL